MGKESGIGPTGGGKNQGQCGQRGTVSAVPPVLVWSLVCNCNSVVVI